ncbi:hypothetical protein FOA52_003450 [Chlamydomonas sp. UWO 241]|nr:hypothetical protein FOA52_003450 [Chlamydomonas sp. UWO 241]
MGDDLVLNLSYGLPGPPGPAGVDGGDRQSQQQRRSEWQKQVHGKGGDGGGRGGSSGGRDGGRGARGAGGRGRDGGGRDRGGGGGDAPQQRKPPPKGAPGGDRDAGGEPGPSSGAAENGGGGRGRERAPGGGGGGRGGGRGDKAAAAASGACFNCGEVGHLGRDCPQKAGAGGGGGGACFNCGETGHLSRDCPQKRAGGGGRGGMRGAPRSRGGERGERDDDVAMLGADDDEDDDVMAMVAAVSKRDATLEQDLASSGTTSKHERGEGVVDFDDDDGGGGKRRRFGQTAAGTSAQAASGSGAGSKRTGGAAAGSKDKPAGGDAAAPSAAVKATATARVKHVPGALAVREGPLGPASADVFGEIVAGAPGGAAGDGSWVSLGLDARLIAQLGACNFERPTEVQRDAIPKLLVLSWYKAWTRGCSRSWAPSCELVRRLDARLVAHLGACNFERPTEVQRDAIPKLLARKDALVKAPTGSGKTLAYLVPILNDLCGATPRIGRPEGTFAVIIAPTRELCIQIQDVAAAMLRRFVWIIAGVLIGGEHRGHEKARLRKGMTIVVATPGRLQDHLDHTTSFRTADLRWLILDEADRLLDLGFQDKLRDIIAKLDERKCGIPARASAGSRGGGGANGGGSDDDGKSAGYDGDGGFDFDEHAEAGAASAAAAAAAGKAKARAQRCTALYSATLHQALGDLANDILRDPVAVGFKVSKAADGSVRVSDGPAGGGASGDANRDATAARMGHQPQQFSIPSQLRQAFVEVAAKDRLVALAGLLRQRLLRKSPLLLLAGAPAGPAGSVGAGADDGDGAGAAAAGGKKNKFKAGKAGDAGAAAGAAAAAAAAGTAAPGAAVRKIVVFVSSCAGVHLLHQLLGGFWEAATGAPLLSVPLLKLHGDMPQTERTAAFLRFNARGASAVLVCTDVAARGLDFPDVSCIVQYDVPGAPEEYVHRVGRTARMGHGGEALLLLMPHERPYVDLLATRGIALSEEALPQALKWLPPPPASQLRHMSKADARDGGASGGMAVACALQRAMMNAVASDSVVNQLACDAFRAFTRAYATHPKDVKRIFNVRALHLGHIAFAFGLKDTPTMVGTAGSSAERKRKKYEASVQSTRANKKALYSAAGQLQGNAAVQALKPKKAVPPPGEWSD